MSYLLSSWYWVRDASLRLRTLYGAVEGRRKKGERTEVDYINVETSVYSADVSIRTSRGICDLQP